MKYTDPDGRISGMPSLSPREFFGFLFKNEASFKTVNLYANAANGNKQAQALAKDVTVAATKELAAESLEKTATIAEFSGEVLSDLALETTLIQPEFSAGAGTASTICAGVEIVARVGKAAITGKQEDIDKAKKTAKKNTATSIAGATPGIVLRKLPAPITIFLGNISSKFVEDKMKNEGSDAEQK